MNKNTIKFLSEIQMLKRQDHNGFRLAGLNHADSLADHSLACAQIAFILAESEGADPYKSATLCIFHDNNETRIGDHHKVSARYLNTKEAEIKAEIEQFEYVDDTIGDKILPLLKEKRDRNTIEGIVAQDADWLEAAIQAKIYLEQGFSGCQNWIDNVEKVLETNSAKQLLAEIKSTKDFTNIWWQDLKKMTYEKL